jgi:TRAP-type mannitol/chloroaromatic compound transport system substrate-binding protein
MLVIKQTQIQYFIAANDDELTKIVTEAARAANAERLAEYDDETVTEMIKLGIRRARAHNFERAEIIAAFVAVMLEIAPNFDEEEQIKLALSDANFPPDERFFLLFERVSDESWQAAENLYDARVWFPENV